MKIRVYYQRFARFFSLENRGLWNGSSPAAPAIFLPAFPPNPLGWADPTTDAVDQEGAEGSLRYVHDVAIGNSTMNVAPWPRTLSHQTLPFMASTNFFTMDKPRPVECSPPVGLALKRANFPKSFF